MRLQEARVGNNSGVSQCYGYSGSSWEDESCGLTVAIAIRTDRFKLYKVKANKIKR